MQNIKVSRYQNPKAHGWAGYLEPEDKSWIAFVGLDGRPLFFLNRDPETGGILGDDPATHAEEIAQIRAETHRQRIGQQADGSAIYPEGEQDPLVPGERIFPLGHDGTGGRGVEP